jgi:hypothetical protein
MNAERIKPHGALMNPATARNAFKKVKREWARLD